MKLDEIVEGMKWDDPVDLLAVRNTDRDPTGRKFGPKTKQKILKKDIINSKGRHGPKSKLPESSNELTEGFGDKFGSGFGRRSHSERVRDEARDLGEPAPATNFFGRGSRSAESRNGTFNIMINGKLWSKDGQPVSFSDMNKAATAAEKVKARMAERGQQGEVKVVNGAR